MSPLNVLLAEDHEVVRRGLRMLLEAESDFTVVGETGDGIEALRLTERLQPDVLVLDLGMPGLGGLDVLREVRRHCAKSRVVVLSGHAEENFVQTAIRNGAHAYVLKSASAADLVRAIRDAAAGRRFLSEAVTGPLIDALLAPGPAGAADPYESLTTREREVLHLAAAGCSNPDIAARLFISRRTVETHRANLLRKLGLRGQTDLVRFALERGLVSAR